MWKQEILTTIVDYFLLWIEWWVFSTGICWVPHDIIIWHIFYWITNFRFSHILLEKHLIQFSSMEYYWVNQLHARWDPMSQCSYWTPSEFYVISLVFFFFCLVFCLGNFFLCWFIIGFYFYFHALTSFPERYEVVG